MNFECPYCQHHAVANSSNFDSTWSVVDIAAEHLPKRDRIGVRYTVVACPNTKCKQYVLTVSLSKAKPNDYRVWQESTEIQQWRLLPASASKPQPDYIPSQIIKDYEEACLIASLSPKASATLSRRCLQGMIRDYWKISLPTLKQEIDALEDEVPKEEWEAIDAVRSVGNIGAHMEKDVDVIVDIDSGEAEILISLIEDLFKGWYVARNDRQQRRAAIVSLAASKAQDRKKSDDLKDKAA